ncbi:MFS transporter [Paenibacillus sp. HWE-109]|uniref:staphylopine family metallophore export MFS transporter CntE n=1 Tax=Paenibacillus sp. HWE-109 TaxID=1306526 RepID=UPI001EE14050|nr:MFS transporter [Paenibacillus sp. HWE-109]UKS29524.1 MFS transporter [Paenibacillus sp. HWE-109]
MNRNGPLSLPFIKLYAITFLFFSANPILNIIVPLRSEAQGASNAAIGVMMGAYMITSMLFRPWAGSIVQRFGPLSVLRVLLLTNGLILILYTISRLEWYFALRAMQGITTAFFSLSLQLGIVDKLAHKDRSQGISLYLLAGMLPTVIGPILALTLWDWGGMNAFTIAMIIIALATGILGFKAPLPSGSQVTQDEQQQASSMSSQLRQLWTHRAFLVCSTAMLIASVSFGAVTTFIALYTKQSGVGHAGIYLMLQAGVMVFCRFALRKKVPSDGQWHPRFLVCLLLSMAVGLQLLALAVYGGASFMYAGSILIGLGMALLYPHLVTYLTIVLPMSSRNTLIGVFIAVSDLGSVLGNIVMGTIADHLSYSYMYGICAGLLLTTVAIILITGRRLATYSN